MTWTSMPIRSISRKRRSIVAPSMAIGLAPRFAMALSVCGKSLTSGHASLMKTWACMSIVRTRCPPTRICRRAGCCAKPCRASAHEQNATPVDLIKPRRLNFMPRMVSLRRWPPANGSDARFDRVDHDIGLIEMNFVAAAGGRHECRAGTEQGEARGHAVARAMRRIGRDRIARRDDDRQRAERQWFAGLGLIVLTQELSP